MTVRDMTVLDMTVWTGRFGQDGSPGRVRMGLDQGAGSERVRDRCRRKSDVRSDRVSRRNPCLAGSQLPARHAHPHAGGRAGRRRQARRLCPAGAEDLARPHGGKGLDRPDVAETIRRRRIVRRGSADPGRGDAGPRLPRAVARDGVVDAGPGAAGIRHGGATTGTHPENRARRDPLVPGLLRAGRGLGPRQPVHPRGAAGRAFPGQRA